MNTEPINVPHVEATVGVHFGPCVGVRGGGYGSWWYGVSAAYPTTRFSSESFLKVLPTNKATNIQHPTKVREIAVP